ncbi:glutamine amidotransferase-related protein [Bradyrhizobium genosp. SA-3]|uniref:glutamine amidotransferase-related protein n=1 Tax=Bradyrhizobium genosp. SA-3 TaxID=508868 RepID=UPI003D9BB9F7
MTHFGLTRLVHFDYHHRIRFLCLQYRPLFFKTWRGSGAASIGDLVGLKPRAVVISPGPCTPVEAGISTASSANFQVSFQFSAFAWGISVSGAFLADPARGTQCTAGLRKRHDRQGLFNELLSPLRVGRYHSLLVELDKACAPDITVTAHSDEGEIMALAHCYHPTHGVQFHPESILTEQGHVLLMNFLRFARASGRAR